MTPLLTILLNFVLKITLRYCINRADLAIGSFQSGHALLVRSRPVAILDSSITTDPHSITLNVKNFTMTTCFQYDGHSVPKQLGKVALSTGTLTHTLKILYCSYAGCRITYILKTVAWIMVCHPEYIPNSV